MGDTRKTKGDLNWTDMLAEARLPEVEPAPEDWKTVKQIAAEIGKSDSHTQRLLQDAFEKGRSERKQYPVFSGFRYYPIFHYRMIEK